MSNGKINVNIPTQYVTNVTNVTKHKKCPDTCIEENCMKRSSFNIPNKTNPLYCLEHKRINTVDVRN